LSIITGLVLRRRSVAVLAIVLLMVMGVFAYNDFQRELFPEIEFPNITIITVYPNADPDTVARDVTEPIEASISGLSGLSEVQSVSGENISLILATFVFGEDLDEAESEIINAINSTDFPDGVKDSTVSRINNDTFPVIQLSVSGARDIASIQRILDDQIIPRIEGVQGVFRIDILGEVDEKIFLTIDPDRLKDLELTMDDISNSVAFNNTSFPAGDINSGGTNYPVRTTHELGSLDDLQNLTVGMDIGDIEMRNAPDLAGARPVSLYELGEISLSTSEPRTISRTNGKPSLSLAILKDPDANTVDVTEGVLQELDEVEKSGVLPSDIEILVLSNDGPIVKESLDNLLSSGALGFLFAVTVVFVFLLNIRPSLVRGILLSLRPTIVIAISIPLSILLGILFMSFTDLTLNFMSLAGLAIAVGRVVDDSIVVLENMYRHVQRGESRFESALSGTSEVGAAIISSTLTTVVVFIPLAFIPGLVGEFFSPFAISVSLALIASTIVAITAVPVLGSLLLKQDEQSDSLSFSDDDVSDSTFIQRVYTPILIWSLGHKAYTLLIGVAVTLSSLGLLFVIPITFFPSGTPEYLTIDVELPTGTSVERTYSEVIKVEEVLGIYEKKGFIEVYQVTLGTAATEFGPTAASGGFDIAGFFVRLNLDTVPGDIADQIRGQIPQSDDLKINIREISGGPPSDALEINVTGNDFGDISRVARELEIRLNNIDGIVNVSSNITDAKDEVVINVDPSKAAEFGLTMLSVGSQVNRFLVGQTISEMELEGVTLDVVLRGPPDNIENLEDLKRLPIDGPFGRTILGAVADVAIGKGPSTISRFDEERSASIQGDIIATDTRGVGTQVEAAIASIDIPPGVVVKTGGIFEQISEGFEDVFQAMAIGIVLVYLVMVTSLGSLRNPFIIVLSLPLAIVGALAALAITDRTLSLSALMGFLLLIGVVVTNAIVLLTFVEQLRNRGYGAYDALVQGGRIRLRPILMTAFTTTFALFPLAAFSTTDSGIIGAELATVVIGGLFSSTFLTLIIVPVIYMIMNESIPLMLSRVWNGIRSGSAFKFSFPSRR